MPSAVPRVGRLRAAEAIRVPVERQAPRRFSAHFETGSETRAAAGCHQGGSSLTEVLIALLVLTLGVVSMAALQLSALKLNHQAYLRSQAELLGAQILDAMRANHEQAVNGAYRWTLGQPPPTGDAIAHRDLALWLRAIEQTMRPYQGQGAVRLIDAAGQSASRGNRFEVTIQWQDRYAREQRADGMPVLQQVRLITEL